MLPLLATSAHQWGAIKGLRQKHYFPSVASEELLLRLGSLRGGIVLDSWQAFLHGSFGQYVCHAHVQKVAL